MQKIDGILQFKKKIGRVGGVATKYSHINESTSQRKKTLINYLINDLITYAIYKECILFIIQLEFIINISYSY